MIDQVKNLSHEMRLFGIHAAAERRAQEALAEGLHPLDFLRLVLEDERLARRDRVAKALTTRAKFRSPASIEEWDRSYDRGLSAAQLKDLGMLNFYHNRENLVLLGATGTGKTHLAIALGRLLCADGTSVTFCSANILFEEIAAEKLAGNYLRFLAQMKRANVLVLDDFGLRPYTHEEANALMDILEERYRKGPVIITSQVEPEGWKKLFEDPVIAEALVDRLTKPCQKRTLTGGSYRDRVKQNS